MEVSRLLQRARMAAGLSQAQVARRAGTSQPVISAYERGHRDPTVSTLRRLVRATGAELDLRLQRLPMSDLPPPVDDREHGQRLLDVLSLADAIPQRRRRALDAPILRSVPGGAR